MKVLHLNIRASQGGAGRVALDLHRRLRRGGIESRLLYGYGSGIKDDPMVLGEPGVQRIGTVPSILFNYACHRAFGLDPVTGNLEVLRSAIASTDIVHLHAVHHHFLSWNHLIQMIRDFRKPTIVTTHDWWFITGRCGFTEECEGWKTGCGTCGFMRFRDPKSLFDFSRIHRKVKVNGIRKLSDLISFICPAKHLASDYRTVFPDLPVTVIPNSTDLEFEEGLNKTKNDNPSRYGIVVSAADLSSEVKVDRILVNTLANQTNVEVTLVGRNNPFRNERVKIYGEVHERLEMVKILRGARALIFCSRTDICPLTIIEALAAGCYVLAYPSAAATEILSKVGGRCVTDRNAMVEVINNNTMSDLYGGIGHQELARKSQEEFSGDRLTRDYIASYKEALK